MPELDYTIARHFRATQVPSLSINGRNLPLIYKLASTLVSSPHGYALLIIDLEGRFDATRLSCTEADAHHIYVQRPPRPRSFASSATEETGSTSIDHLRSLVVEADSFMLYSPAAAPSASRRWWGSVILGGLGAGDVVAGWKGWLRVEREHVRGFAHGTSAEEALDRRSARQEAVDATGWVAESQWGGFVFREED